MSPRRRATKDASYRALKQFARAHLHQDFIHEYGGAVEATRAFGADATKAERRALAIDLTHLVEASADWPSEKLSAFMTETIGAAWATASVEALREMTAALDAIS